MSSAVIQKLLPSYEPRFQSRGRREQWWRGGAQPGGTAAPCPLQQGFSCGQTPRAGAGSVLSTTRPTVVDIIPVITTAAGRTLCLGPAVQPNHDQLRQLLCGWKHSKPNPVIVTDSQLTKNMTRTSNHIIKHVVGRLWFGWVAILRNWHCCERSL